jgi:hypothetical protein
MPSKIIYMLFAAAVMNGATDRHAAPRPTPAEHRTQESTATDRPERPLELRGAIDAAALPPLPSPAELRLAH